MQLNHYNTKFKQQTFPITIVCDNINNALNIGSLFRIADAFGVEKLVFCGQNIPIGRKMSKTSRATEQYVDYVIKNSARTEINLLKEKGYVIIALEITNHSISLNKFQFSDAKPIAIIIGDENFGISEDLLNSTDHIIHINMFGQNSSMNVVQATNIALYEMTKQLNK